MKAAETWMYIHAERSAMAETLSSLSEEQWAAPSWCGQWPVRMTAAHILVAAEQTPGRFYVQLVRAGLRFDTYAERIAGPRLTATDCDWSTGTGPEVTGPLLSLIMAMSGRRQACQDLTGDGSAALANR
jgi:Mycothiol maleylpyruvate isomerase N-terminal domain